MTSKKIIFIILICCSFALAFFSINNFAQANNDGITFIDFSDKSGQNIIKAFWNTELEATTYLYYREKNSHDYIKAGNDDLTLLHGIEYKFLENGVYEYYFYSETVNGNSISSYVTEIFIHRLVDPLDLIGDSSSEDFDEYRSEVESVWLPNERVDLDAAGLKLYLDFLDSTGQNIDDYKQTQYALARFIHHGTDSTRVLGAGERAGVLGSYFSTFNRIPYKIEHWQDVIKIGSGRWPSETNLKKENESKELYFKKIYKRDPEVNNERDNAAITVMTYGLRPANRNMESEANATGIFKDIFKHPAMSSTDWDVVRAIAYSGSTR